MVSHISLHSNYQFFYISVSVQFYCLQTIIKPKMTQFSDRVKDVALFFVTFGFFFPLKGFLIPDRDV